MVQSDSSGVPLPREEMPDWLLPLRNAFLASLLSRGLKTGTVRGLRSCRRLALRRSGAQRADDAGRR